MTNILKCKYYNVENNSVVFHLKWRPGMLFTQYAYQSDGTPILADPVEMGTVKVAMVPKLPVPVVREPTFVPWQFKYASCQMPLDTSKPGKFTPIIFSDGIWFDILQNNLVTNKFLPYLPGTTVIILRCMLDPLIRAAIFEASVGISVKRIESEKLGVPPVSCYIKLTIAVAVYIAVRHIAYSYIDMPMSLFLFLRL